MAPAALVAQESKVAVAMEPSLAAETARPANSLFPNVMAGAVLKPVQFVPSREKLWVKMPPARTVRIHTGRAIVLNALLKVEVLPAVVR